GRRRNRADRGAAGAVVDLRRCDAHDRAGSDRFAHAYRHASVLERRRTHGAAAARHRSRAGCATALALHRSDDRGRSRDDVLASGGARFDGAANVYRCSVVCGPERSGGGRRSMRRVPPVFLCVLVVMWLLLNNTISLGHIVLGFVLSALLLLAAFRLRPLQPTMRRFPVLVRLFFDVLIDIIRSNIGVARVVLGLVGEREVHAGFIHIPIDMRDPHGFAVLAMIITATPGTIW